MAAPVKFSSARLKLLPSRLIILVAIALVVLATVLFLLVDEKSQDHLVDEHLAGLSRRKISSGNLRIASEFGSPEEALVGKANGWNYEDIYGSQAGNDDIVSQPKYHVVDNPTAEQSSLILRIEELKRIKLSMKNELRQLEREKSAILKEKTSLVARNERLLAQLSKSKLQLKQLELDIVSNRKQKMEHLCDTERVSPILFNPMKSFGPLENYTINSDLNLTLLLANQLAKTAFDLSRCPLSREFTFSIEGPANQSTKTDFNEKDEEDILLNLDLVQQQPESRLEALAKTHKQFTRNSMGACLVLTCSQATVATKRTRNYLVIDIPNGRENIPAAPSSGSPASASFSYALATFRANLDLVVPSVWQPEMDFDAIVGSIPPLSPLERKYLASYFGNGGELQQEEQAPSSELSPFERTLQIIHRNSIDDLFLFIYDCGPKSNPSCFLEREKMIESSVFVIILPSNKHDIDENSNNLLYLTLSKGAIPVIIGKERIRLPFDEVIDWSRASLLLPTARLPELHFVLRSISSFDLYSLKYFGRHIFEKYLATSRQIFDTIISIFSLERFNFPPIQVDDVKTYSYNSAETPLLLLPPPPPSNCSSGAPAESCASSLASNLPLSSDEILGPRERPFASASFRRNFSLALSSKYDLWNKPLYSPKRLYPSHPNDPIAPSEFKFLPAASSDGFRPIGDGLGGSGFEFSRALGGDHPNEQFTIVVLTYERKQLLTKTLERLRGMAYLNKILVVWNSVRQPPTRDMLWPDVGVPLLLVKVDRNSLNNRFLPYDAIETDAIFSMDDDSPLRPDEIVFAFRVWRQSRDRIVGFPGRYHAWNLDQSSWLYNSNHSCELSMVLTGGAFFHKYYTYMYTYEMSNSIRQIVDKFMNCEDIAMNFLVAHLTRKPPIKVTSRWTFHCANCVSSLSEDDLHFRERHECLNIFASIYGYMPLLNTQHRSDSILFKTRLPHDKQKCFKFV